MRGSSRRGKPIPCSHADPRTTTRARTRTIAESRRLTDHLGPDSKAESGPGSWGARLHCPRPACTSTPADPIPWRRAPELPRLGVPQPLRRRGPRSPLPPGAAAAAWLPPCGFAASRPSPTHGLPGAPSPHPSVPSQPLPRGARRCAASLGAEAGRRGGQIRLPHLPGRAEHRFEARGLAGGRGRRRPAPSPSQKAGPSDGRPPSPHHRLGAAVPPLPHQPEVTSVGE